MINTNYYSVGCGSTCPATVHLANTKKITSYLFEPSAMAESAKSLVAKLPVKATGIEQDKPGERPYHVYRLPAHEIEKANPPKCDVIVLNRMIHEWRLFEKNMGQKFEVSEKLHEISTKFLKPGGILIVGDFEYQRGIEGKLLEEEMAALKKRLGHTHTPEEYVKLEDVRESVKYGSGFNEIKSTVLGGVEKDTHRMYWMCAAQKEPEH